METAAQVAEYVVSNIGMIFSMFLGAVSAAMMCWGFGRG